MIFSFIFHVLGFIVLFQNQKIKPDLIKIFKTCFDINTTMNNDNYFVELKSTEQNET